MSDAVIGDFLCPDGFNGPVGTAALLAEGSVVSESVRGLWESFREQREFNQLPYAGRHKRPGVIPVMLIPGFMGGDWMLQPLAGYLRRRGFRTYRAGIKANVDCTSATAEQLEIRIEKIVAKREQKIFLVGHSLGGMLARGLAARRPDLISGIITMGSPVLAPGAVHQLLAWDAKMLAKLTRIGVRGLMSQDCLAGPCAAQSWADSKVQLPEQFLFTAIYSKKDGIVDWRACLDPAANLLEVATSHAGMPLDPLVMQQVLAELLTQTATTQITSTPKLRAV